ncbi:hypothetical protein EDD22DRAFT_937613 [Suillus occidentalis]|nr:hypothetical protein EDD22DRAFT_937613 [Suillus occidentalis]
MQLDETLYPGDLTLPSVDFEGYDEKELKMYIQDVSSVTDITNLLTRFVLRTIANCLHILHDVQERDDAETVRELLQFRRSCTMCPVKDDIFDVVFLPGSHPDRASMIILVIPPWALNIKDFLSFINTGTVFPGSLDEPASASTVMWALLWDMCSKQKCQYFAVTTYGYWALGNFNHDMETAYISNLFRAPVFAHDAQVEPDWLPCPGLPEILLFWMAACVRAGGILWTPV